MENYEMNEVETVVELNSEPVESEGLDLKTVLVVGAGLGIVCWEGGKKIVKKVKDKITSGEKKSLKITTKFKRKPQEDDFDEEFEDEQEELYEEVEE